MIIEVALPFHLRRLAHLEGEVVPVEVEGTATPTTVLAALEEKFRMLRGTIREHGSHRRRSYLRYFADGRDISHENPDEPLPEAVTAGREPFIVIGAISGG